MRKQPLMVQLDDIDRDNIERLSELWDLSLSGTVRRLMREHSAYTTSAPPPPPEPEPTPEELAFLERKKKFAHIVA